MLATLLADRVISLGSIVGFHTVLGIASRNAILLINHYQHLEREEREPFRPGRRDFAPGRAQTDPRPRDRGQRP